ncbi:Glutathione S-transferase, N-terminal [Dillenia turbinata]|uniref:Glutathione S-transferase, N-terminal n=1 Tax=Dillenia turbinata TaxID=194707 RepID=A0AAN8VMD7_9MAGN
MSSISLLSPTFPTLKNPESKSKRKQFTPTTIRMSHPSQSPNPILNPKQLLTNITRLLWGKSLPPQLIISTVRSTWTTVWQLMMAQMAPSDPSGDYTRPTSQFRANFGSFTLSRQNRKTLHLYVGLPCPWAHRTLIVMALKGLESVVPVSVASPGIDGSWVFDGIDNGDRTGLDEIKPSLDRVNGCKTLREVYKLRQGGYDGRATVPMLWDVEMKEVVCNESYDIIELFNSGFGELAENSGLDLSPPSLKARIEEWNSIIYHSVNNGVYKCGFSQSQEAYDAAVNGLFDTLDMLDDHLCSSRYLCGDALTLADVCLFTTLIRFDLVYNVLFKCTKKKLVEYPNLHGYMRDIYQIPKVAETCNFGATMDGYYKFLFPLNPGNIRPIMPAGCGHEALSRPHNRESLSPVSKTSEVYAL